jgi:hypothetical protein
VDECEVPGPQILTENQREMESQDSVGVNHYDLMIYDILSQTQHLEAANVLVVCYSFLVSSKVHSPEHWPWSRHFAGEGVFVVGRRCGNSRELADGGCCSRVVQV